MKLYFVLLMKSHLQSYPCPLQINSFWNLGLLLGITIILQIITGILLGLHYTSDINSAYSSVFFFIREIYYGWCLHYLHSSGASFVFLFHFQFPFLLCGFRILHLFYLHFLSSLSQRLVWYFVIGFNIHRDFTFGFQELFFSSLELTQSLISHSFSQLNN